MTIYLLFAIGLKGGVLLEPSVENLVVPCINVVTLGALIPLVIFPLSKKILKLSTVDSAHCVLIMVLFQR